MTCKLGDTWKDTFRECLNLIYDNVTDMRAVFSDYSLSRIDSIETSFYVNRMSGYDKNRNIPQWSQMVWNKARVDVDWAGVWTASEGCAMMMMMMIEKWKLWIE